MNIKENFYLWLDHTKDNEEIFSELNAIKDNEEEISDRFYRELAFGTGGLRGKLGAGTNRMNIYTVAKATAGLAKHLLETCGKTPRAAVAYDSRINSKLFAEHTAKTLASHGVKVFLYPRLMPTPALSFAVRQLACDAGIVITASHNPAAYNGYKVYASDGCQITPGTADAVYEKIRASEYFPAGCAHSFEHFLTQGSIQYIEERMIDRFLRLAAEQIRPETGEKDLSVVYTPLCGAGYECVTRLLKDNGYVNVTSVPEQSKPDGTFPTCPYPNPENKQALEKGLALCEKIKADLLLATDPDCDRVGVAVRNGGEYLLLDGNEIGLLLFDYLLKKRAANKTLPKNPVVIKTIVTTDMAYALAQSYGAEVIDVLTGFKYIGEQIGYLEQKNQRDRYVFGFEESYGYLCGTYVRDKDGVSTALLVCEAARHALSTGQTLADEMERLYREYGYYKNKLYDMTFEGKGGLEKMRRIMQTLRLSPPRRVLEYRLAETYDYQARVKTGADGKTEPLTLPASDVLKFCYENMLCCTIRPSGTEPKLKMYCSAKSGSPKETDRLIHAIKDSFAHLFQ